jgi:O-antigen/teichoic acid export membrane protein
MNTARSVVFKTIAEIWTRIGNLITFPILIHYIKADGYGAYGQLNTVVGFVVPFASLGLAGAMVRFFSAEEWDNQIRTVLFKAVLITIIVAGSLSVIMSISAPVLNDLFLKWDQGIPLFRWGSFLIILMAIEQLFLNFMRARLWITEMALIQISKTILMVIATVFLIPKGLGLISLVKAILVIEFLVIVSIIIGLWTLNKPKTVQKQSTEKLKSLKRMIGFGIPFTIAGFGLWCMNTGDRLLIGHFMTPADLGIYGAVYTLALLLVSVNAPILVPLYPRLMRSVASGNPENFAHEVRLFHRYIALLQVPSFIFIVVMTEPVLFLIGGTDFQVGHLLISMVALAVFLDQYNGIAHYLLTCVDKVVFRQNTWILMGILNLIGNYYLIQHFGLHGAAFVTLVTFIFLEGIILFKAMEYFNLLRLYRFDITMKALLCCLPGFIAIMMYLSRGEQGVKEIIISSIIFGILYILSLGLFHEISRNDILLLLRAVNKNLEKKFILR